MTKRLCRFCAAPLALSVIDLGVSPLSNAYLNLHRLAEPEAFYPLHARVCTQCWLVQVDACVSGEAIFHDYAYFSSYSESWVAHARQYALMAVQRFQLNASSQVIEVASNDGYLLASFQGQGIPVLGIEPSDNVAKVARGKGIPTWSRFFGRELAEELQQQGLQADLLVGNNVLAHVPDLNDFVAGLAMALKPTGVLTLEFPSLVRLIAENQFDTIYQEHYSYFSFTVVCAILQAHGLIVFDVEQLSTHGGSLRVFSQRVDHPSPVAITQAVTDLLCEEAALGVCSVAYYQRFTHAIQTLKRDILKGLIAEKEAGSQIVGYGAPAKGNTLLNYCGIGPDFLDYTVDKSPHKQGLFLPGSRIPIFSPDKIAETRPDVIVILPWNLCEEIAAQLRALRDSQPALLNWQPRCMTFIPRVEAFRL
jgi:2-polyprenyl-3-methyl-5-hydroxy-6-metoxy-1,4-benzoquinol methylase